MNDYTYNNSFPIWQNEQAQELHERAAIPVEYICPRCNGFGAYEYGANTNPGGTNYYETKDCELCDGDGVIELRKIVREPRKD